MLREVREVRDGRPIMTKSQLRERTQRQTALLAAAYRSLAEELAQAARVLEMAAKAERFDQWDAFPVVTGARLLDVNRDGTHLHLLLDMLRDRHLR